MLLNQNALNKKIEYDSKYLPDRAKDDIKLRYNIMNLVHNRGYHLSEQQRKISLASRPVNPRYNSMNQGYPSLFGAIQNLTTTNTNLQYPKPFLASQYNKYQVLLEIVYQQNVLNKVGDKIIIFDMSDNHYQGNILPSDLSYTLDAAIKNIINNNIFFVLYVDPQNSKLLTELKNLSITSISDNGILNKFMMMNQRSAPPLPNISNNQNNINIPPINKDVLNIAKSGLKEIDTKDILKKIHNILINYNPEILKYAKEQKSEGERIGKIAFEELFKEEDIKNRFFELSYLSDIIQKYKNKSLLARVISGVFKLNQQLNYPTNENKIDEIIHNANLEIDNEITEIEENLNDKQQEEQIRIEKTVVENIDNILEKKKPKIITEEEKIILEEEKKPQKSKNKSKLDENYNKFIGLLNDYDLNNDDYGTTFLKSFSNTPSYMRDVGYIKKNIKLESEEISKINEDINNIKNIKDAVDFFSRYETKFSLLNEKITEVRDQNKKQKAKATFYYYIVSLNNKLNDIKKMYNTYSQ
jgi:hypothetical protein